MLHKQLSNSAAVKPIKTDKGHRTWKMQPVRKLTNHSRKFKQPF